MSLQFFKNGTGNFTHLTVNGIYNFFTYSNDIWGNMRLTEESASKHFQQLFSQFQLPNTYILSIGAEHNDAIRVIDQDNYNIYAQLNEQKKPIINLTCDAIITKERLPIIITPGDCAVVILTGIDARDGKRFMAMIHAGFTGAILQITTKTIQRIHELYDVENTDIQAAVFPYINGEHYVKSYNDTRLLTIIDQPEWQSFLDKREEGVAISFGKKVEAELIALDITFESSKIDTYIGQKDGILYSERFQREHNYQRIERFGVGAMILD